MSKITTNFALTWSDPNIVITYAEVYGVESYEGDDLVCVAVPGTEHMVDIGSGDTRTTVDWRKETALGSASRSTFITAVLGLVQPTASTPDNHYIITTKDELDTAITDATTAAVPYRFEIAAGTYAYTSSTTVTFPENGEIVGAGLAVTRLTASFDEPANGVFSFGPNTTVRDIKFDHLGNGHTTNYDGLCRTRALTSGEVIEFRDCEFTGFDAAGLTTVDGVDGIIRVLHCRFTDGGTGATSRSIFNAGTGSTDFLIVHDCLFRDVQFGVYLSGTESIDIQRNRFMDPKSGNGGSGVRSTSNAAREVIVLENHFHNWPGTGGGNEAVNMPTSYGSLLCFKVDVASGSSTPTYAGIQRIGDERRDTEAASQFYNNTLSVNCCSLTDVIPGRYRFSYQATLTDVGSQSQIAVVLDNTASAGAGLSMTTSGFRDAIVGDSQSCNNSGLPIFYSRSFVLDVTAVNDYHLVFVNRSSSTASGIEAEFAPAILTVGDNIAVLSALRIS